MIKINRIIQAGDATQTPIPLAVQTDEMLTELSRLYLGRCRAMQEHNEMAVDLFNRQISTLKAKLSKI